MSAGMWWRGKRGRLWDAEWRWLPLWTWLKLDGARSTIETRVDQNVIGFPARTAAASAFDALVAEKPERYPPAPASGFDRIVFTYALFQRIQVADGESYETGPPTSGDQVWTLSNSFFESRHCRRDRLK